MHPSRLETRARKRERVQMLVACRMAGLSAPETHYGSIGDNAPTNPISAGSPVRGQDAPDALKAPPRTERGVRAT
jgi:hypothetical protein